MLKLPAKGFYRSVDRHNVDLGICCDWIEASALFCGEDIAAADIVDVLRESEIYKTQDFAWALVNDAMLHIRDRARLIGAGYPFLVQGATRVSAQDAWEQFPAYSFCLALSLPGSYPEWARNFGQDYNEQGELFEALTAESVRGTLTGWVVHSTGWTRTTPTRLAEVVARLASLLGEATGDLAHWTQQKANEAGLDLLCFRPFPDGRVGVPVYMFQCASGADWKKKLKSPDLRIWTKIITFASDPKKAFAMPFALSEKDFTYNTNLVDGLLLDRHRLLSPGLERRDWVPSDLATRLVAWTDPRIQQLPMLTAD